MKASLKWVRRAAACIACAGLPWAASAAADAQQLGKELTPVGAEPGGNKEGSIPAWSGATAAPTAGWSYGKVRGDYWAHKGEKPLFSIDASNVEKYAARLSPGQMELVKTLPGYRMDVYPSRRECSYPDFVLANTKANVAKAKIAADGWALGDAVLPGVPFPIPSSGIEAIWNFLTRYQGSGVTWPDGRSYVSPRPGAADGILYAWDQTLYHPWGKKGSFSPAANGGLHSGFYYAYRQPPALEGQVLAQRYYFDKDSESFYYFPGQRRVRRLPSYAYDAPLIGFENQFPSDAVFMFFGNPDRFDWKIVGKKELYVQYNAMELMNFKRGTDALGPRYVSNDVRRYELHRVWQIEGTLKSGVRHTTPKKTLYLDEDTWLAVAGEEYDAQGKLWRAREAAVVPAWEIGACSSSTLYAHYDFNSHRYTADAIVFGADKDTFWSAEPGGDARLRDVFYTPENLRSISER